MCAGSEPDLYDNFINESKSFEYSDNAVFKAFFVVNVILKQRKNIAKIQKTGKHMNKNRRHLWKEF